MDPHPGPTVLADRGIGHRGRWAEEGPGRRRPSGGREVVPGALGQALDAAAPSLQKCKLPAFSVSAPDSDHVTPPGETHRQRRLCLASGRTNGHVNQGCPSAHKALQDLTTAFQRLTEAQASETFAEMPFQECCPPRRRLGSSGPLQPLDTIRTGARAELGRRRVSGAEAAAQDPQGQQTSGLGCTGTHLGASRMGTEELDLPTLAVGQRFLFQWKQKLRSARKRGVEIPRTKVSELQKELVLMLVLLSFSLSHIHF